MCVLSSGVHGSLLKQGSQTVISARLRDVVVLNVDSQTIHSKVTSEIHIDNNINKPLTLGDSPETLWMLLVELWPSVLQAVSIVGDEVFSFSMSLTPNATEGAGYADTSRTDGKVKLNVGCIQVVYLHKFFMSLLVSFTPTPWKKIHFYWNKLNFLCFKLHIFFPLV